MKKSCLIAFLLVVFVASGHTVLHAEAPELGMGFPPSNCAEPVVQPEAATLTLAALSREPVPQALCYAECPNNPNISCTCPGSGTCTASSSNVSCDCSPNPDYYYSCGVCTNGEMKQEPDGCCTPYKGRFRWWECVNGSWEPTQYYMCYGGCDPILPD